MGADEETDPELGEVIAPDAPDGLALVQRNGHGDHPGVEQVVGEGAGATAPATAPERRSGARKLLWTSTSATIRCAAIHIASVGAVTLRTVRRSGRPRMARRHDSTAQSTATVNVPMAGTEEQDGAEGEDFGDRKRHPRGRELQHRGAAGDGERHQPEPVQVHRRPDHLPERMGDHAASPGIRPRPCTPGPASGSARCFGQIARGCPSWLNLVQVAPDDGVAAGATQ